MGLKPDFWKNVGYVAAFAAIGTAGYSALEKTPWVDSLLNVASIIRGVGPNQLAKTPAGKLFTAIYLITCLIFIMHLSGKF